MVSIRVTNHLEDLVRDAERSSKIPDRELPGVVRRNIVEGNRIAKAFASEQHTMHGDTDIEYAPAFTSEMTGRLRGEYGADHAIGDGTQSEGYEHGSINSPPHKDHARSADRIAPRFADDVGDVGRSMFW